MSEHDVFDLTQRILYLRSIPVTALLSPPLLKIIGAHMTELTFAPGEALMREDQPIEAVYLVTEGRVALIKKGAPFGALEPPQSLGFLGIIARTDGNYDARAETPVRALELSGERLLDLLEEHFELMYATLRYLCERLLADIQELPAQAMEERMGGSAAPVPERALDLVERIVYLRQLRAYSSANLNALASLAARLVECRFAPGEKIWEEGSAADRLILIRAGTVLCTADGGAKRWRVEPNSAIGGMDVVAAKPRWYAAEAETAMVGFWVDADSMVDLYEDDFTMAMNFITMLANEVLSVLEKKTALGKAALDARRDINNLSGVRLGA